MRRLAKAIRITPGFWLLLAGVWVIAPAILLPTALAAGCHELGHCAALKLMGGGVERLRLSGLGAELVPRRTLSYTGELPVALAGPCVSLLAAALAARWGHFLFAGLSLALGIFNLLPVFPLDGGRALRCLCALILPAPWDRRVPRWLAIVVAGLLLGVAMAAFARFGGLSLLVLAAWLCYQSVKEFSRG